MTHTAPTKYTAAKAIAGTVVAGALAFVAPIVVTVHAGQAITGVTWLDSGVAALVFMGAVFPTVYNTTNKPLS